MREVSGDEKVGSCFPGSIDGDLVFCCSCFSSSFPPQSSSFQTLIQWALPGLWNSSWTSRGRRSSKSSVLSSRSHLNRRRESSRNKTASRTLAFDNTLLFSFASSFIQAKRNGSGHTFARLAKNDQKKNKRQTLHNTLEGPFGQCGAFAPEKEQSQTC